MIRERQVAHLSKILGDKNLKVGDPVFIRIFKLERLLEVWIQQESGQYVRFKTYPICAYSGKLGPKLREGDRQAPEGFYSVSKSFLNPNSSYHLSFNLGFPNAYDSALGRTGSFLMVHGSCVSAGCYAMTDAGIEEIYVLVERAFAYGQNSVPVHIFPFIMNEEKMKEYENHQWFSFWENLREGYELFNINRVPPFVYVEDARYKFKVN